MRRRSWIAPVLLGLAACGPPGEPATAVPAPDTPPAADDAPVIDGMPAVAGDAERIVNVYIPSGIVDESVFDGFQRATGIRVDHDVYASPDILETKLLAGNSGYDVVMPTGRFIASQLTSGVFRKLDKSRLENRKNLWRPILERTADYDPGNAYSINFAWGTTGIGYNESLVLERMADAPVDSWRLVFDPERVALFADCGVHIVDSGAEVVRAALNHIGEDPGSQDPAVIEKAEPVLAAIRPFVKYVSAAEQVKALANGDACVAVGRSRDVLSARVRAAEAGNGVRVAYSLPREGASMWFDQLAIPADAPHPLNAHLLLDFLMRPDVMAIASRSARAANGNLAAQDQMDAEMLSDPGIYPPAEVMRRLYASPPLGLDANRAVMRVWARARSDATQSD